ncbi:MAG: hypothetical protein ACK4LB_01645 [Spirosomataceae bacterium]
MGRHFIVAIKENSPIHAAPSLVILPEFGSDSEKISPTIQRISAELDKVEADDMV